MTPEESLNLPPRRMGGSLAVLRLLFIAGSLFVLAPASPYWLVLVWFALWAINFGRDAIFGISPTMGPLGCLVGGTAWLCWLGMVAHTVWHAVAN